MDGSTLGSETKSNYRFTIHLPRTRRYCPYTTIRSSTTYSPIGDLEVMKIAICILVVGLFAPWISSCAQGLDPASLLKPAPDMWPTYYGDYTGRRYSSLSQINTKNAGMLTLAWAFQTNESNASIKSTPLLVNGVLYFTIPDQLWAVDARSGRQLWHYTYPKTGGFYIGQRGAAMYLGWVYFLSNDGPWSAWMQGPEKYAGR